MQFFIYNDADETEELADEFWAELVDGEARIHRVDGANRTLTDVQPWYPAERYSRRLTDLDQVITWYKAMRTGSIKCQK